MTTRAPAVLIITTIRITIIITITFSNNFHEVVENDGEHPDLTENLDW